MHKRTDTNTHISVEEFQSAMSKFPLKKSYVDTRNPKKPARDIAFYKLWDEARNNGFVGNILNLETGERMTNLEILDLVSIWLFTYGLHLPLGETVQHSKIVPYQHCINGNDWILLARLTRIDNLMSKTRDRVDVRVALLICLKN